MTKAARITEARKAAGFNKSALAREIGVSHTTIGLWEKGDTKDLKNDHLYKLEQITGYSAKWIVSGKGDKFSSSIDLTKEETEFLIRYRKASETEKEVINRVLPD